MRNLVFVEGRLIEWLRESHAKHFQIAADELPEMVRALELSESPPDAVFESKDSQGRSQFWWLGRHLRIEYQVSRRTDGPSLILVTSAEVWEREVPDD